MKVSSERKLCPYVGLQPFEEADREFFFGRERDQRIIIANLLASPLTILYGSSGVGKSSVLMAGVVPQLRRDRPRTPVVVFRDWFKGDLSTALAHACIDAVWKEGVDEPKPAVTLPFDEVLRACAEAAHETLLLILDQFEEYFLYHPKSSDPAAFEAGLARAVNREDVDVGVLLSLRDDGLAKLDRFKERIPDLMSNRLELKHLEPAGAAEAIREPLAVWNEKYALPGKDVGIDGALVTELIRQVGLGRVSAGRRGGSGVTQTEQGYVEAPFLQLVLVRLWKEEIEAGANRLHRETFDRLGGAKQIVRSHLADVMAGLDADAQAVCATFFDRLVTPSGTKVACLREDLARWAGVLAGQVPRVLKVLEDRRILRTVGAAAADPRAVRYEIYHDVLAPAILDWRQGFMERQERLHAVEQARKEAKERARRLWIAGLATVAVFAIVGWVYAIFETMRAEANQMASTSIHTAAFDAGRGVELALAAVDKSAPFGVSPIGAARLGFPPTPAAEDALRQVIQSSRLAWTLRAGTLVSDIALSPDGRMLATAGKDGTVKLWDISDGYPRPTNLVFDHEHWVRGVSFLPMGDKLLTVANDTAYLWSIDDPSGPTRRFVHGGPIYSAVAVSTDGRLLATAGDGTMQARVIKVWDLETDGPEPQPLATIDVAGAWVMGLAFSPDGCCLATACVNLGGPERTATSIWEIATGAELFRLPLREASDAVAFTPDGKALVTASRDARVRVWQPAGGELDGPLDQTHGQTQPGDVRWLGRILAGHGERVRDIAIGPDGKRIASAGGDHLVKLWDMETGENLLTLQGHGGYVETVAFSHDGQQLISASRDRTVKLWNIAGHTGTVNSVAFGPAGNRLATASSDRKAMVWDLSAPHPRLVHTLNGHTDQVYRVAFHPNGRQLATAGFDNRVKLWDPDAGTERISLRKHQDQLRDIAFSPDGKYLASVGADGYGWLYPLEGETLGEGAVRVQHFEDGNWAQASAVAFSADSDRWATAGHDGRIRLWGLSGEDLGAIDTRSVNGQGQPFLFRLAFTPDGSTVLALARRWVYLWSTTAFRRAPAAPIAVLTIEGAGYCSALAPDWHDGRVAVGCNDAGVRIFDVAARRLVKTITVHRGAVTDLAFSPDGSQIATASVDGSFHVSPLAFEELYEAALRLRSATKGEEP